MLQEERSYKTYQSLENSKEKVVLGDWEKLSKQAQEKKCN